MREEAVDDAVMLALKEDAETYAPTLLEVAKLALHRPLASLGLVGILESRSSLRQRIERLHGFPPAPQSRLDPWLSPRGPWFRRPGRTDGRGAGTKRGHPIGRESADDQQPSARWSVQFWHARGHQPLYIRNFRINEDTLVEGLHVPMGPVATNDSEAIFHAFRDYLSQAGVDLDPARNPGKACFYSDRSGLLMVRATLTGP